MQHFYVCCLVCCVWLTPFLHDRPARSIFPLGALVPSRDVHELQHCGGVRSNPCGGGHWVFVKGIKWRDFFKRYWKIQYMDCRLFVLVVMLLTRFLFRYWVEWCQALLFRILSSFGYTDAFLKTISAIWIALEHGNHMKPLYHVSFRVSVFC